MGGTVNGGTVNRGLIVINVVLVVSSMAHKLSERLHKLV